MEIEITCKCSPVKYATKSAYPQSRHKHASCAHENHVYVYAGKDGNISLKDFWRFNSGCMKWEKVCYRGDTPQHLEGHTLVSYKKLLLLFGGEFGDALTESSLWIINPDLGYIRKTSLDPGSDRPCVRRDHSAVVYSGSMYIYGGYVDVRGSSSELWRYQVDDEEWENVSPRQPLHETPGGRYGHTAVVYNKDMWLYGGHADLTPKQDLWTYSFGSNRWERIKFKYGPPQLTGHSAIVVGSQMILYGGETKREPVNQMWSFNFKSERWSQVILKGQIPCSRTLHCAVVISPSTLESVKASSMPYLQKKMKQLQLERPRSSPAERPRSSPAERSRFSINSVESDSLRSFEKNVSNKGLDQMNPEKCQQVKHPQVLTLFSAKSNESLKVFPSPAENAEDKSPLVPRKTDLNYNAVTMLDRNTVNNQGIDNPGISKSTEELIRENHLKGLAFSDDIVRENNYNCLVQPDFTRSVSCSSEADKRKNFIRQNTDSGISMVTENKHSLGCGERFNHICAKRSRLDSDLVLEDLEYLDCFPQSIEIPYPRSYCSKYQTSVSSESLLTDSDGVETIELEDFRPRVRSKSACHVSAASSVKNSADRARYDKNEEKVYLESEQSLENGRNRSSLEEKDIMCNGTLYDKMRNQREIMQCESGTRMQGEVTTVEMESSFQCFPTKQHRNNANEKVNGRYTKHKKTVSVEPPYLLVVGGKEIRATNFSIKALPLWRLELSSVC